MATTLYNRQFTPTIPTITSILSIPDAPNITIRPPPAPPAPRIPHLPRTHSTNANVVATTTTTSSATSPVPQQQLPPTGRPSSWLAARLLASGYDLATAKDCERRLVLQEGFALESDFVDCLPTEFNRDYLSSIGITGLGTQKRLLALHNELHSQRQSLLQTNTAPPPPLPLPLSVPHSSSSLPVEQNVAATVKQVAAGTMEDDNSQDPVFVEQYTDESALDPVYVEPIAKRSKVTDNESVHECKQS